MTLHEDRGAALEREARLADCERAIGHVFTDRGLLELALTHSSLKDSWRKTNERLEYLGDAVLGLAVSEHLFLEHPDLPEGELTHLRSRVVSRLALARAARRLGLDLHVQVGKGVRVAAPLPDSILADALEALLGAVHLDGGYAAARQRALEWLGETLAAAHEDGGRRNCKSDLQQWTQALHGATPRYRLVQSSGPDHCKRFEVEAVVAGRVFPRARGASRRQAEQRAARLALALLRAEDANAVPPDPAPGTDS